MPVHARHHHVGDDDGGAERGDELQRFLAVGRGFGHKAPGADQLGQPARVGRIVFDDEHALGLRSVFCDFSHSHSSVPSLARAVRV